MSQRQLAQRLDEPQSWVSRIESGETRMHVIELCAYCLALGISPVQFVEALEAAIQERTV